MTAEQLAVRFAGIVADLVPRVRALPSRDRSLLERACVQLRRQRALSARG